MRGTVIKAGHRKLQCQYLAFECSNCEGSQIVKQTDGLFTQPVKCATKGCRNQPNFKPLLSSPHSRSINWRTLRIQELSDEAQVRGNVYTYIPTDKDATARLEKYVRM